MDYENTSEWAEYLFFTHFEDIDMEYLQMQADMLNRVLSDVKVHEMQQYFWSILDSLKDKNK